MYQKKERKLISNKLNYHHLCEVKMNGFKSNQFILHGNVSSWRSYKEMYI
jgi:hypothetical protein